MEEEGRSFISSFHFSFWKISFNLILNCEHSHNKSKSLPKRNPSIQTSVKRQSVFSDAYDNSNFIKAKLKPPPREPANHLSENSEQNLRQNKMEGEFIYFLFRSCETLRSNISQEIHRIWAQVSLSKTKFNLVSSLQFCFSFCYLVLDDPQNLQLWMKFQ